MEILTEWDKLVEAMSKVDLDDQIMPTVNGRLVENVDSYNKIQKILETPELINAHKYIYNLDVENLDPEDVEKVDKIYDLGIERGFIQKPDDTVVPAEELGIQKVDQQEEKPVETVPYCQKMTYKAKIPSWTVLYSAWKDGNVKTGECYSNSINPHAAKADCYAKLTRCGYDNINILAIEAGDPDCCGAEEQFEADQNVIENDMLNGRNHNLHVDEADKEQKKDDQEDKNKEDSDKNQPEKKDDIAIAKDPGDEQQSQDEEQPIKDDKEVAKDNQSKLSEKPAADAKLAQDENPEQKDQGQADKDTEGKETSDADDKAADGNEDSGEDQPKELSDDEKVLLKNDYKKLFKQIMLKCGFEDKCFDDLTIEEKIDFFTELNKAWGKNEPKEFMTDKEIEQQNKIVMKK